LGALSVIMPIEVLLVVTPPVVVSVVLRSSIYGFAQAKHQKVTRNEA
jgi:hypothetical protein